MYAKKININKYCSATPHQFNLPLPHSIDDETPFHRSISWCIFYKSVFFFYLWMTHSRAHMNSINMILEDFVQNYRRTSFSMSNGKITISNREDILVIDKRGVVCHITTSTIYYMATKLGMMRLSLEWESTNCQLIKCVCFWDWWRGGFY